MLDRDLCWVLGSCGVPLFSRCTVRAVREAEIALANDPKADKEYLPIDGLADLKEVICLFDMYCMFKRLSSHSATLCRLWSELFTISLCSASANPTASIWT